MANPIGSNYSTLFKNVGLADKNSAKTGKNSTAEVKNPAEIYGGNYSVELSSKGLNALAKTQTDSVDDAASVDYAAEEESALLFDEGKISAKAQDFLSKLREKYGDYDFFIADDMSDPQKFSAQGTKGHSVVLSTHEIERMAEDEEYAESVMGKVDKAAGTLDELAEKSLGEGVEFTSLAAEIDEQGNMKLFAGIEKMSEEQRERLEKLKEQRAEEKKDAAAVDEEEHSDEEENFSVQSAEIQANSIEELLDKISQIDWSQIAEETFTFASLFGEVEN